MKLNALFSLLSVAHRKKSGWIVVLFILRSLLDFAGIAAVLSLLYILLGRAHQTMIVPAILGGTLFIALKNVLTIRIDMYCSEWFLSLYRYYSACLLNNYYSRGLLFIREKGSTALTYEVNSVCYAFAMNVLFPAFQIIGKSVLIFLLFAAFSIFSPYVALVFLISTALTIWFYTGFIRNRIAGYGKEENRARKQQWRNVQDIFGGYMEIESNQAYGLLSDRFGAEMENISLYRKKIKKLQQIPSALMETGMMLALLVLLLIAQNNRELIILLGVFTVAGMRILPSVRAVISCWMQIRNHYYTIEIITDAMQSRPDEADADDGCDDPVFNRVLVVSEVSFSYKPGDPPVLDRFSMRLEYGECVGIQGMSGIGKSTLVNLLLGFFRPDSGRILIDDVPLSALNMKKWRRCVGYVPQEVFIIDGTVAENIALGVKREDIDAERIYTVLKQMRLDKWIDELPMGVDTMLGENGCLISGGQKQRIGIARALYRDVKVLFFDEATSALDQQTEEEILQIIRHLPEQGYNKITLLMIAHRQSILAQCDRIVKI